MKPMALSGSVGGDGIALDDPSIPGKLIHEVPTTAEAADVLRNITVINDTRASQTLWYTILGPGLPAPTVREDMTPVLIPVQKKKGDQQVPEVQQALEPGYSLWVSCDVGLRLFGWAERYVEPD